MRYEQAENLVALALEMQAARSGISLAEIQERFGVSKRTAQRMRDSVLRLFADADEVPSDERQKRWRIPKGTLDRLVGVTADELGNLEVAIKILRQNNMAGQATSLEGLTSKLRAVLRPDLERRVAPDLEALLEAERLAMRPGPRPRTRLTVLEDLREAIKACREVEIHHIGRTSRRMTKRAVQPYGFLYGHRHYLVAYDPGVTIRRFRLFSLPNIERVEMTGEFFERNPEFSLDAFSRNSFGIFQEEPFDVVWKFSARAAPDAAEFLFHPDQIAEEQPDGSLIVSFRAGGALEMCWHLYCWGNAVEVLEPKRLADMCRAHSEQWPGLP